MGYGGKCGGDGDDLEPAIVLATGCSIKTSGLPIGGVVTASAREIPLDSQGFVQLDWGKMPQKRAIALRIYEDLAI